MKYQVRVADTELWVFITKKEATYLLREFGMVAEVDESGEITVIKKQF